MPRGQKECPKCNKPTGPRTKICDGCGYVYLQDSVDKVIDGIEISAKVGKKQCSNCSKEMESEGYNTDPYGKTTYYYKYDSYCSVSCLEAASERKDDLISEILNKIIDLNAEDFDNVESLISNLNSFISEKRIEEDYSSLIEDIEKRAIIEKNEEEYRKTHPYIVHVTTPIKRITTPQECYDLGLQVPPKIGEHIPSVMEENSSNPLKRLLKGELTIEDIESEENEESEESEESEENEIFEETEDVKEEVSPLASILKISKPNTSPVSSLSNVLGKLGESKTSSPSGIIYDSVSKPRQGQKKCRGRCGMIVGVRTKVCPGCSFQF